MVKNWLDIPWGQEDLETLPPADIAATLAGAANAGLADQRNVNAGRVGARPAPPAAVPGPEGVGDIWIHGKWFPMTPEGWAASDKYSKEVTPGKQAEAIAAEAARQAAQGTQKPAAQQLAEAYQGAGIEARLEKDPQTGQWKRMGWISPQPPAVQPWMHEADQRAQEERDFLRREGADRVRFLRAHDYDKDEIERGTPSPKGIARRARIRQVSELRDLLKHTDEARKALATHYDREADPAKKAAIAAKMAAMHKPGVVIATEAAAMGESLDDPEVERMLKRYEAAGSIGAEGTGRELELSRQDLAAGRGSPGFRVGQAEAALRAAGGTVPVPATQPTAQPAPVAGAPDTVTQLRAAMPEDFPGVTAATPEQIEQQYAAQGLAIHKEGVGYAQIADPHEAYNRLRRSVEAVPEGPARTRMLSLVNQLKATLPAKAEAEADEEELKEARKIPDLKKRADAINNIYKRREQRRQFEETEDRRRNEFAGTQARYAADRGQRATLAANREQADRDLAADRNLGANDRGLLADSRGRLNALEYDLNQIEGNLAAGEAKAIENAGTARNNAIKNESDKNKKTQAGIDAAAPIYEAWENLKIALTKRREDKKKIYDKAVEDHEKMRGRLLETAKPQATTQPAATTRPAPTTQPAQGQKYSFDQIGEMIVKEGPDVLRRFADLSDDDITEILAAARRRGWKGFGG